MVFFNCIFLLVFFSFEVIYPSYFISKNKLNLRINTEITDEGFKENSNEETSLTPPQRAFFGKICRFEQQIVCGAANNEELHIQELLNKHKKLKKYYEDINGTLSEKDRSDVEKVLFSINNLMKKYS
jgi:hypothetical protein